MRDGVIMLFYDLSMLTKENRRDYRMLVKKLKREGYYPLQESVFFKYLRNISMFKYEIARIRTVKVAEGNVFCLPLSFGTFSKMVAVHGTLPDLELIKSPYLYF